MFLGRSLVPLTALARHPLLWYKGPGRARIASPPTPIMPGDQIAIRRAFGLLVCLGLLLRPSPGRSADPLQTTNLLGDGREVEVSADRITREADRHVSVAEGAVDVRSGNLHLVADHMELNDDTMDATATGHVVLESGQDRLQGENLQINLRTKTGFLINGQGFAQAYYFTGERIEKLSEDRYHVLHGTFTSCEGVVPDWSFHSPDALIHVDHYIYSWNPTMWVKKLPVFYVPYAIVPIKRNRATGLLVPHVRLNKSNGWIVTQGFFWAPVDNADATLTFDWYGKRGLRYGLEANYVLDVDTYGSLESHYIRDRLEHTERWDLTYLHKHALPGDIQGLIKLDFNSDRTYQSQYSPDLQQIAQEKLDSYVSLTRSWGTTTLTLSGEHQENLVSAFTNTLDRYPELNLGKAEGAIGDTPLYWSLDFQGVGLHSKERTEEKRTTRFDAAPRLSWPINIQSWATLKPSIGAEYTYYTEDKEGQADDRFLYNPRVEWAGPKFYRIFGAEDAPTRFKHLIYPTATYNYVPLVDQERFFSFDAVDRVAADNSVNYGLVNQVLGKYTDEEGKSTTRQVLKLEVDQKYFLDTEIPAAAGNRLGGMVFSLEANPVASLTLDADLTADVNRGNVDTYDYGFTWAAASLGNLGLTRRFSRATGVDYLEGTITVIPGKVSLTYRGRYDLQQTLFVENYVEVKYTAQCWDATLSYVRLGETYEYRFLLNLKEIGTIIKF